MTIAIGHVCHDGVIVAADTAVWIGEEELQEGTKLHTLWGPSGSFAIVDSSHDANATASLIAEISDELQTSQTISDYKELRKMFKRQMTDWRKAFGGKQSPHTELLLGVKLKGKPPKLFFCQPPNTMVEKDDYVAAGIGAKVTDPLHSTLFGNNGGAYMPVGTVLRRIAYLVYRAKKDSTYCGKHTDCAVVWRDDLIPDEVHQGDMAKAENASQELDFLLSSAAIWALISDEATVGENALNLGDILKQCTKIRSTTFHDYYGDEIKTKV